MTTGEVISLIKAFGGGGGGSSGGGVLVVHDVDGTLDKTWAEIAEAVPEKPVLIISVTGIITTVAFVVGVQQALKPGMKSYVTAFSPATDFASSIATFSTYAFDGYPALEE